KGEQGWRPFRRIARGPGPSRRSRRPPRPVPSTSSSTSGGPLTGNSPPITTRARGRATRWPASATPVCANWPDTGAAGGGRDGDDRRKGRRPPGPEGHRRRGEGRRDGTGHPGTGQLRGDHAGGPVGGGGQGALPRGLGGAVARPRPGRGAAGQTGGHPAERALADAQAPGLPGRLGGGAPPPGRGRRAGTVSPGRHQGDGLDRRRGRGAQALADGPEGDGADHQPARGRGRAARVASAGQASCISRTVNECGEKTMSTCSPSTSRLAWRTFTASGRLKEFTASGLSPVTSWTLITPVAVASSSRIRVLIDRRGSRLTTDSVSLLRPGSVVAATSSRWNRPRSLTRWGQRSPARSWWMWAP